MPDPTHAPELRLNVGCGRYPVGLPGWLNIDSDPEVGAFVCGLGYKFRQGEGHLLPFVADGEAAEVYCSHTLEHYPPADAEGVPLTADALLAEFRRVLRPGGLLRVAVPDTMVLARGIAELESGALQERWIGTLFGFHKKPGDTHWWGYTADSLAALLRGHGFEPCGSWEKWVKNPAPGGEGYDCAGAHCLDVFGKVCHVSLNMQARRLR
ncbi:MAG TPA: methyltransferase domain-containing protein [Vicinamibacterales bacterium]|nr:methyltransferase domain-containing protein [Vicinamibacterales bacterium]